MHMADALISPTVGGILWASSIGASVYAAKKLSKEEDKSFIPMMGVSGAFIFASQMINFSIPMTGSSGHLGGGLLLAILLGPNAAFITIFSVLAVQALFFADGGLLALGANVFNMGIIPAYFIFPYIYKPLVKKWPNLRFIIIVFSAIAGLELGAFGVVLETLFSKISALPFTQFIILMLPIHLAIGIVEGIVSALIVEFVYKAYPQYMEKSYSEETSKVSIKKLTVVFFIVAIICGSLISYLASSNPDGLEWSIENVTNVNLESSKIGIFKSFSDIQDKISFLPDYSFKDNESLKGILPHLGTGISGIVGISIVTIFLLATGYMIIKRRRE